MKHKQLQAPIAVIAGIAILALALLLAVESQPPLSPDETKLVGEWSLEAGGATRKFTPNRQFSTFDGQYCGVWHIHQGQLTVTYWQPFQLPQSISISSITADLDALRRSRKRYAVTWKIEFSDGGQHHTLSHSVDAPHSEGPWLWIRETDLSN